MSEARKTLIEKLKTLPIDEVLKYESAAVIATRVLNTLGVLFCLLMFIVPDAIIIILCVPVLLLLANMGAGIGNSLIEIRRHLQNPKSR